MMLGASGFRFAYDGALVRYNRRLKLFRRLKVCVGGNLELTM